MDPEDQETKILKITEKTEKLEEIQCEWQEKKDQLDSLKKSMINDYEKQFQELALKTQSKINTYKVQLERIMIETSAEYDEKSQDLVISYNEFFQHLRKQFAEETILINSQIAIDTIDYYSIEGYIEQNFQLFSKEMLIAREAFEKEIIQKEKIFEEELENHQNEARKKEDEFLISWQMKVDELQKLQDKKKEEISKDYPIDAKVKTLGNYFRQIRSIVMSVGSMIGKGKQTVEDLMDDFHHDKAKWMQKLQFLDKYDKNFHETQKEFEDWCETIKLQCKLLQNEQEQLKSLFPIKKEQWEKEILSLQDLLKKENDEFQKKLEEFKIKDNSELLKREESIFFNQLQKELYELSEKYEKEKKEITQRFSQLHDQIHINTSDITEAMNTLKMLSEQFSKEEDSYSQMAAKEKANENESFQKLYQEKIQQLKQGKDYYNVTISQKKEDIERLNTQLKEIQDNYEKELNELNSLTINDYIKQFDDEKHKLEISFEQELNEQQKLAEKKIETLKNELDQKQVPLYSLDLSDFEKKCKESVQETKDFYENEYSQLEKELKAPIFQSVIGNVVEKQKERKTEIQKKIFQERHDILVHWNEEKEKEIQRHETIMKHLTYSNNNYSQEEAQIKIVSLEKELSELSNYLFQLNSELHSMRTKSRNTKSTPFIKTPETPNKTKYSPSPFTRPVHL